MVARKANLSLPSWLWVTIACCFVYHICVLSISPLPWFDETYFASMTLNFMDKGVFMPKIGPMLEYYYPQSKAYGPGYFLVLGLVYKIFGFGLFQTRLPGLIFGFLVAVIGFKILRLNGLKEKYCSAFSVLLLLDPIFLQNIHSGRMDSMTLLLALSGFFFLFKGIQNQGKIYFVFTGLIFGLALLTTPRIAVVLIGPSLFLAFSFIMRPSVENFSNGFIIFILAIGFYSIWIFWGFGGIEEFYNYFFGPPKHKIAFNSLAEGYISSKIYIPKFQIPALGLALVGLIFCFRKNKLNQAPLLWIFLAIVLSFYTLVNDTGIYSIFLMPFVYGIILYSLNQFPELQFKGMPIDRILFLLLVLNGGIFLFKNSLLWTYSNSRNIETIQAQVSKIIPKGSRVIGDDAYYYFVIKAGSDYQYLDRGADTPNRRIYHENEYNYQYVIAKSPPSSKAEFDYYNEGERLEKIYTFKFPKESKYLISIRSYLAQVGFYFPRGYEGVILKRK